MTASTVLLASLVPSKITGLPSHPLLVHVPIAMIPLAVVAALVGLLARGWRSWLLPLTVLLSGIGLVGMQLAMSAGEQLQEAGDEHSRLIERHAHLAGQTRPLVALFVVVALVAVVLDRRARRVTIGATIGATVGATGAGEATVERRGARPHAPGALLVACALSVASGGVATAWVMQTGHTGAQSVWHDKGGRPKNGGDKSGDDRRDRTDRGEGS